MLNIPRTAVYDSAAKRAHLHDRFWIREPYYEITPRKFGAPQSIHALVMGHSPAKLTIPAEIKPYLHGCKLRPFDGSGLHRGESRAQLEIMTILADAKGFLCRVHMTAVDQVAA